MSDPSQAPEFSPDELDLLEDALEDDGRALPDGAAPRVVDRLAEYRELLALSREAMPLEDPRAGLLDGVIAEALASAAEPARSIDSDAPGLWARLRRSLLLPGLALAGTAAFLLIVMRPDAAEEPSVAAHADAKAAAPAEVPAAAPLAQESAERELEETIDNAMEGGAPASAASAEQVPKSAYDVNLGGDAEEDAAATKLEAPADERSRGASKKQLLEPPAPAIEEKQVDDKPRDKDSAMNLIDDANKLRRQGKCVEARKLYEQATESTELLRARAFAGMGLCDEFTGDFDAAERNFDEARGSSKNIDTWIELERAETPSSKKKRKASRAAKPSPKANADEALEESL
ncbi:MAG: hypothetical protein R3A51_22030 [Nannocystaceae bacterium]|nr:hypothetical protein [Myxococcales bacterium]